MPIFGVLTRDPCFYFEAADKKNMLSLKRSFANDTKTLLSEYEDSRKYSTLIKPEYDGYLERVTNKFGSASLELAKPLLSSLIVTDSYTSDGDRFFHDPSKEKWWNKLIKMDPENDQVSTLLLPH